MKKVLFALMSASFVLSACTPSQIANAANAIGKEVLTPSTSTGSSAKPTGFPSSVKMIALKAGSTMEVSGKLEDGQVISDLSWASTSNVACFPATQNAKFKAPHTLYYVQLPPRSILTVKLVPDTATTPMSLYGYQIGTTNFSVVPALSSATTCEADHINERPVAGKTEDGTRKMTFNATTNPYNVVIGVSGSEGSTGGYKLQVTLEQ